MQALEAVDLVEHRRHLPSELSGGQRQRVTIARTLAGDPAIILADEPTVALDSKTSLEIVGIFKRLNEQGRKIVLITHDLAIAQQAKLVIYFRDGRLSEVGSMRAGIPLGFRFLVYSFSVANIVNR